jgi:carbonic anhydrase
MRTYRAIKNPKPTAIILRCSDPRFRIAFRDFAANDLELAQGGFVPINIAGGPAILAHRNDRQEEFSFIVKQIYFFLNHFPSIRSVVLIGHEDCGFYATIENHPDREEKERKDLPRAAKALDALIGNKVEIKTFYAKFADESQNEIIFETVAELCQIA